MTQRRNQRKEAWPRQLRLLLAGWAVLLALMLGSLWVAYLPLGPAAKAAAGLLIAAVKSLVVVFVFMQLGRRHVLVRLVASAGVVALLLMAGLSAVDYSTRLQEPAPVQVPQQLER